MRKCLECEHYFDHRIFTACPDCGAVPSSLQAMQFKIRALQEELVLCRGDCPVGILYELIEMRKALGLELIKTSYTEITFAIVELKEENEGLRDGLRPFANYACTLADGETCDCHNCRARELLARKNEANS